MAKPRARRRIPGRHVDRPRAEKAIFAALRAGHSRSAAAARAGVFRSTLWRWLRDDAEFAERCEEAEGLAEVAIVDRLLDLARNGDREAIRLWLKSRRRAEWDDGVRGGAFDPSMMPTIVLELDSAAEEAARRHETRRLLPAPERIALIEGPAESAPEEALVVEKTDSV